MHTCEHVSGDPKRLIPIQHACFRCHSPLTTRPKLHLRFPQFQVVRHEVAIGKKYNTLRELVSDTTAPALQKDDFVAAPNGVRLSLAIALQQVLG